jgi:hypothetical protein
LGQWFTPIILASQEGEIRMIAIRGQPKQKVETLTSTNGWVHLSSQAMQEAEVGITVPGQPRQKNLQDPVSKEKADVVLYTCHLSFREKHKIGGSQSRLAWEKSKTLTPK